MVLLCVFIPFCGHGCAARFERRAIPLSDNITTEEDWREGDKEGLTPSPPYPSHAK